MMAVILILLSVLNVLKLHQSTSSQETHNPSGPPFSHFKKLDSIALTFVNSAEFMFSVNPCVPVLRSGVFSR